MIYELKWYAKRVGEDDVFTATVPGDVQRDYAEFKGFPDLNFGTNCNRYLEIEDSTWIYITEFYHKNSDAHTYFVTDGIDYECECYINGEMFMAHEGMFEGFECDITDKLKEGINKLEIKILPPPKSAPAPQDRSQANHSVKPPASYGWDWHPRVIPSGIWNGAKVEVRDATYLGKCALSYVLAKDYSSVKVSFTAESDIPVSYKILDRNGKTVAESSGEDVVIENPELWWCRGQGDPYLYTWEATSEGGRRAGKIGFRSVSLSMNEGAWDEPNEFPKGRSDAPITMTLNGRKIFSKGSNMCEPDVFTGNVSEDDYRTLVSLAKDANMNIFRMWGGAGIQKDIFYDLCDEAGIMVWQEFTLACNNYPDDEDYLEVLESESRSIVRKLRSHPSVVLYGGGNELFNVWSGMTEQSHPLRLLNKVCYEEARNTPFIYTSPIIGMAHGGYLFYSPDEGEIYQQFGNARKTAYTEFGVPAFSPYEYLKGVIPADELDFPTPTESWTLHHAFSAWTNEAWGCIPVLERYFGKLSTTEQCCYYSAWLQCEGYKAAFEEARRQWPHCSMVVNWDYNEPWATAANNSILSHPAIPKPAYYAVKDALRDVMPSARIQRFSYLGGESFEAELWMLNDSPVGISDSVKAYIEIGGEEIYVMSWENIACDPLSHKRGHKLQVELPIVYDVESFELIVKSEAHGESRYKLHYKAPERKTESGTRALNF